MKNIIRKHEVIILSIIAVITIIALNLPSVSNANNSPERNPIVSNISIASVTSTTAIVTWVTDVPTTGVVYYGFSPNKTDSGVGGSNTPVTHHAAVLTNLSPSSKYFFTISVQGSGKGRTKFGNHSFTTATAGPQDVSSPTMPTMTAEGISMTDIRISWIGASDASGIASYVVFRDGGGIASLNGVATEYIDSVAPGALHTYSVRASDPFGNYADTPPVIGATLQVLAQ